MTLSYETDMSHLKMSLYCKFKLLFSAFLIIRPGEEVTLRRCGAFKISPNLSLYFSTQ